MKLNLSCSVLMKNSARSDEVAPVGAVQMNDALVGGVVYEKGDSDETWQH